jgi:hypothetical protein
VSTNSWTIDDITGKLARENRERTIESVLAIFAAGSPATPPETPRHEIVRVERDRRAARLRAQIHQPHEPGSASFEDTSLKQRALEPLRAA